MGYILPFNHYQYSQYAKREEAENKNYDPFQFQPIVKATLRNKKFDQFNKNQDMNDFLKSDINIKGKKEVSEELINSTLADLEGKGQYFNEYV